MSVVQMLEIEATGSREFEEIFNEYSRFVYRIAYAVIGRHEDAEDVLQTIFLRLASPDLRISETVLNVDEHFFSIGKVSRHKCGQSNCIRFYYCDRDSRECRFRRLYRLISNYEYMQLPDEAKQCGGCRENFSDGRIIENRV